MVEYIEREAVCYQLAKQATIDGQPRAIRRAAKIVAEFPTADVRPARRGKWVDMGDFISCSSCNATHLKEYESDYGKVMRLDARANFCPNCGADMRPEPKEEET